MRRFWPSLRDMNRGEWISLAPLIVLVVSLGVYPAPVLEMIAAPVDRIVQAVTGAGLTSFGPLW
jgi:NADH:ubiquinone oxidoreductase subunit 4 (subunit M)